MESAASQAKPLDVSRLYVPSLTQYHRRETVTAQIGDLSMGSAHPIRVQSMTTVDTMDTEGSIAQSIRMIEAGCELVRITAPSVKEAANLENIRKGLQQRGYRTPLVADIHFTPNAAELAARLVEKVRINPGNYADKKKFEVIDYTEASYASELERIRERFLPLIKICKEYGTAMRIGTNHGSLSDRILSRYGDTPLGMVESALEFLRICEDEQYYNIVISMKASNTQVMVQAYRLLVAKLAQEGLKPYPLHLGVTEAGEGEDGRIKSAVGIGTLLEDGLGDTVRVSLTEDPEFEIPVAKALVDRYNDRAGHPPILPILAPYQIDPYQYHRRATQEVGPIGGHSVPRVMSDWSRMSEIEMADLKAIGHHYLPATDKWTLTDQGADFVFAGDRVLPFMLANGSRQVVTSACFDGQADRSWLVPLYASIADFQKASVRHEHLNLVSATTADLTPEVISQLATSQGVVLVLRSAHPSAMVDFRSALHRLVAGANRLPVLIECTYPTRLSAEELSLYAATDIGGLLIDGLGDGVFLRPDATLVDRSSILGSIKELNQLAFGILQAARTRMSKTEYISCPSCGRTLFDLQETTAKIRLRTDHLKGIKIGIMGCIVNGPGEMADADYGYVGVGKGKIALYKGQDVVKKAVPEAQAVDELIALIAEHGDWVEPQDVHLV